ncbi:hypothetical protein K4F52_009341 [Lecanicillium sp. MT-2017a]|nr:hypothetical protein K4F52_009341 [Lecanicillium sp. MT-2017a]
MAQGTTQHAPVTVRQVSSAADIAVIAKCFHSYTQWLGKDLSHQNYEAEVANLPGKYAPPTGALLLAVDSESDAPLGCVAMRPLQLPADHPSARDGRKCAEIKRLFVYPEARGRNVARTLVKELIVRAESEGYAEVFLDTLPSMTAAIRLYESEGFDIVAPYYNSPWEETIYFSRKTPVQ